MHLCGSGVVMPAVSGPRSRAGTSGRRHL